MSDDPLAPARGILLGCVLGVAGWAGTIAAIRAVAS
jgi:hypothetical protein